MSAKGRTEVAVLTPAGRGAVGVVAVRGPTALEIVDAAFRPVGMSPLKETPRDRPRLGRIGEGEGDEVVVVVKPGEPAEVEVHGHGGPAAIGLVVSALTHLGAIPVRPEDWTRGRAPSHDAERDLPRAETLRVAEVLLDQHNGALDEALARLADRPSVAAVDQLLARHEEVGRHLLAGWDVVLAGPPNAGKSRLLNALAGHERAIVAATPGTTRDVVRVRSACAGWPVTFADTAGLRETDHPIEAAGIAGALAAQARADLVVLVLDRSIARVSPHGDFARGWAPPLLVANKSDLPAAWSAEEAGALAISAATGEGVSELLDAIGQRLLPSPTEPGEAVPWRPEQVGRLKRLRGDIERGRLDRVRKRVSAWLESRGGCRP